MSGTISASSMTWIIGAVGAATAIADIRASEAYKRRRTPANDADHFDLIGVSLAAALDRKASGFIWIPASDVKPIGIEVNKPPTYAQTRALLNAYIERCHGTVNIKGKPKRFTFLVDEEGLIKQPHRQNWLLSQLTNNTAVVGDALLCFGRTGWNM